VVFEAALGVAFGAFLGRRRRRRNDNRLTELETAVRRLDHISNSDPNAVTVSAASDSENLRDMIPMTTINRASSNVNSMGLGPSTMLRQESQSDSELGRV